MAEIDSGETCCLEGKFHHYLMPRHRSLMGIVAPRAHGTLNSRGCTAPRADGKLNSRDEIKVRCLVK